MGILKASDRTSLRRQEAMSILKRAEDLTRAAGGRLLVYGSLIEGGFTEHSDVDVLLLDLDKSIDWDVAIKINTMLSLAGFRADVMPARFVSESLRLRALRYGHEPSTLG